MKKYIALLRGINVGGNNKVPMPELKKVFEGLGFLEITTYINTGNVIFATDKNNLETLIDNALQKQFGFNIKTIMYSQEKFQKICDALPKAWQNNAEQKTDILFLWEPFDTKKSVALIKTTPVDNLVYLHGAIAWNIQKKDYKKSGMHQFIGSPIYQHMTARNINTVRKLSLLMQ
jgi:uncharacterized protein (DUF1697 family)